MNWAPGNGSHKTYKRADGEHVDERRLGFAGLMDHLIPYLIIALLGWLCVSTMDLKSSMATVLERTTSQGSRMDRLESTMQSLSISQAELQRQFEERP